jgi:peptidoglycan hydrolase-like protein with peptidoglycan-binding domain
MAKRVSVFLGLVVFVFSLTGCATTRKKQELEVQGLKNQISALEAQIQSKDEEINSLKDSLARVTEEKEKAESQIYSKKALGEVKSRPSVKQIQIALRNAGFEPGAIDGKMGRQTREAIKAFQRAHNLAADGKVGKQTWALLKDYLYQKIK